MGVKLPAPPPPLERHIQAQMVQYLKLTGWCVWELFKGTERGGHVRMTPGMPDLYAFRPGRALWLELKRPKLGRLSPSQVERHIELRLCDIPVHVVTSLEELRAALGAS